MAGLNRTARKSSNGIFSYKARGATRWGLEFTDPATGKRKRKANLLTHAAALAEKETVDRQRAGLAPLTVLRSGSKKFSEAVTEYLAYRKKQGRPDSSYDALEMWWVPAFGPRPIAEITTSLIRARLDAMEEENKWAAATRNNRLNQLSGFFSFAMAQDPPWVSVHPTARGRVPLSPVNNARERWLTAEEMHALCASCPPWLQPIVRFGAATGWRLGEITGVTKADYVEDNQGRGWLYRAGGDVKNGAALRSPLEGWVAALVKAQVENCGTSQSRIFPGPGGGDPRSEIRRRFPVAVAAAGLTYGRGDRSGVTFHTLRHTMASHATQNGVPEREVMALGNWKDPRMARRYSHLADSGKRDAAAAVASALAPPKSKLRAVR